MQLNFALYSARDYTNYTYCILLIVYWTMAIFFWKAIKTRFRSNLTSIISMSADKDSGHVKKESEA